MNVVKLKNNDKLLDLQINYHALFHSWYTLFEDEKFLESDYMNNLMAFLFLGYQDSEVPFRPTVKTNIFKPFAETHIDYCNAVIITEYPTNTKKGNGLGVGNALGVMDYQMTDELRHFRHAVEFNLYNGNMNLGIDWTLEEASENGALFLNSALTCTALDQTAHKKHWELFIRFFLKQFQSYTADKVFLFIGDACRFADEIDLDFHEVIQEPLSLHKCIAEKKPWKTKCLNELNEALQMVDSTYFRNPII